MRRDRWRLDLPECQRFQVVLDSLRALRHDADTPFTGRGVMGPCAWGGGEGHATWRSCEDASCCRLQWLAALTPRKVGREPVHSVALVFSVGRRRTWTRFAHAAAVVWVARGDRPRVPPLLLVHWLPLVPAAAPSPYSVLNLQCNAP